jgi:hypothetical protein
VSRKVVIASIAAAATAVAAYFAVTRLDLLRELAGLTAQGGETRLRDVLRPARGDSPVIVVALDGVGRDLLNRALERGRMPRLAALMGEPGEEGVYEHGYAAPDAVSILPSTTMAAWGSVFTGEPPAVTGVPGNEWFDRRSMRFFAPAPVSVTGHEHTLAMLSDGLVGNALAAPTLFEQADVRSYVSLAPVYRGADLFTMPDPGIVADLFTAVAGGIVDDASVDREAYAAVDIAAMDNIVETIDRHGPADLQVIYFPGIDLYTHGATEPLREQERYLEDVVDPQLGRIFDLYARMGLLQSTWVVLTADHGHTPVLSDDRHALEAEGEDEPPAVLRQAGFRLRPFVLEPDDDEQDYQATVAYQGAIAYVYLADRSTCMAPGQRCDWNRPPRPEQDVLPVARAFDAANLKGEGVAALLGTLDMVMIRSGDVEGERLEVLEDGELVPLSEHLRRRPRPDLVRFEQRMNDLVNGPHGHRAGDILLLARSGEHRPLADRYYFSNLYRSWHGSPHPQDSDIPLIVARADMTGEEIRDIARSVFDGPASQLDFTPLVLELLRR